MGTSLLDDVDPSIIYSGSFNHSWGRYNSDPNAHNTTLTWLHGKASAKIPFTGELFNAFQTPLSHPTKGSSIEVYGIDYANSTVRQPAPECLYTIDEGASVRLTSNQTVNTQVGQLFFQSPNLPITSHVLTIEYIDDSKEKDALVLDYFIVNDGTLPNVPSLSLTSSFLSSTTTTSSTTSNSPVLPPSSFPTLESSSLSSTLGATPTSGVTTASLQGESESKLPIGPIIGGTLGALTFICTVFLILYFRRRRREGHSDKTIGTPPLAIGKNSQFLQYLRWLIIPDSLVPEKPQIGPYNISQPPPEHGGRGKSFVDTRSGMAESTTSSFVAGIVQRTTTQQTTAASSTSNMTIT